MTAETKQINNSQIEGLVKEHAYSIIDVKFIRGEKLLKIRNPWGVFQW